MRFVLLAVLFFETITWPAQDDPIRLERLFETASVDDAVARAALMDLATNWRGRTTVPAPARRHSWRLVDHKSFGHVALPDSIHIEQAQEPKLSASHALREPPDAERPTPRSGAVVVQLGVPVTKAPRGLTPPSHAPCPAHQMKKPTVWWADWARILPHAEQAGHHGKRDTTSRTI
jgi:hypothetical protein